MEFPSFFTLEWVHWRMIHPPCCNKFCGAIHSERLSKIGVDAYIPALSGKSLHIRGFIHLPFFSRVEVMVTAHYCIASTENYF